VIAGRAPARRTLRLHKDFTTATNEACSEAVTGEPFDTGEEVCIGGTIQAQQIPDHLDYTTVVPASGVFEWHVTPSTRPFVAKTGNTEAWKLTCEDGGKVVESHDVVVARGARVDIDLPCGGTLPPPPVVAKPKPKPKPSCKQHGKKKRCKKPAKRRR
jgi:hypothetical protein